MFNLRKDQDNARTLGRALSKGADLGGAFDKHDRGNVSSIKHSDLGIGKRACLIFSVINVHQFVEEYYSIFSKNSIGTGNAFFTESLHSLGEEKVYYSMCMCA